MVFHINRYAMISIIFILIGCSTKQERLSSLINEGKFVEADSLLSTFTNQEKATPQLVLFSARVNAALFADSMNKKVEKGEYLEAVLRCSERIEIFSPFPSIRDSLRQLMVDWATKGASYYYNKHDFIKAYNCFEPLPNTDNFSDKQSRLFEQVVKAMLSGIWEGKSQKRHLTITMRIDPLTTSTFTGRVKFAETHILSDFQDGFFDGKEISATYPIRITRSHENIEGVKGTYENGSFRMFFPIAVIERSQITDYGNGTYGGGAYMRIAKEECVMKKKAIVNNSEY